MSLRVGVFAADESTAQRLADELTAHDLEVAARAVVDDEEPAAAHQYATYIADAGIDLVVATATAATRTALIPLITKRLLGFSDLADVDGGRCDRTIVILVPAAPAACKAALAKALPRVETELARKSGGTVPPTIKIPSPARKPGAKPPASPPRTPAKGVPAISARTKSKTIELDDADINAPPPRSATEQAKGDRPPLPQAQTSRAPKSQPAIVVPPSAPSPALGASSEPAIVVQQGEPSIVVADEPKVIAAEEAKVVVSEEPPPVIGRASATAIPLRVNDGLTPTFQSSPAIPVPAASAPEPPPAAAVEAKPAVVETTPAVVETKPPVVDTKPPAVTKPAAEVSAFDDLAPMRSARAETYHIDRSSPSKRGLLLGGLAVLVLGGGAAAYMLFGSKSETRQAVVASGKPVIDKVAEPASDRPEAPAAAGSGSDAADEIEIDETNAGSAAVTTTRKATTGSTATTGTPPTTANTTTTTGKIPTTATSTTTTTGKTPTTATTTATTTPKTTTTTAKTVEAVSADGCDKVSCVIDNFERPCCEPFRPRKPGELPVELDKAMITTGMSKAKAAVIRCGEQTQAKGIVKIAIQVKGDGQVGEASVAEAPDPALGECVANAVRKVSFAKTESGGSFTYPFKF